MTHPAALALAKHGPNERTLSLAHRLQTQTAPLVTLALVTIRRELDDRAPYVGGGDSSKPRVSGGGRTVWVPEDEHGPGESVPVTSVEAALFRAERTRSLATQVNTRAASVALAIENGERHLRALTSECDPFVPDVPLMVGDASRVIANTVIRLQTVIAPLHTIARCLDPECASELNDRHDGWCVEVHQFDKFLRMIGGDVARSVPEPCDGSSRGYEGHQLVWTKQSHDPRNGWHDPTCREIAGEIGLCDTCRRRMNHWRGRHGLTPIGVQAAA